MGYARTTDLRVGACANCNTLNGEIDRHCGVCGRPLAKLEWSVGVGEESWQSGNGRLAVNQGTATARVLLRAQGSVPIALTFQSRDLDSLPPWIDAERLRNRVLRLEPDAEPVELVVPLVEEALRELFDPDQTAPPTEMARLEARLPLLTNLTVFDRKHGCSGRPFTLRLHVARRPWLEPQVSFYRFLPVERTSGEGFEHVVTIHNKAAQALEIDSVDIEVEDDMVVETTPEVLLPAKEVVRPGALPQEKVEPGKPWSHALRIVVDPDRLPHSGHGRIAARVRYVLRRGGQSYELVARLRAVVGRGPSLVCERIDGGASSRITFDRPRHDQGQIVVVRNPGGVPVRLESIEIARIGEASPTTTDTTRRLESKAGRDWLSFSGVEAGDVIAPGELRRVELRVDPAARSSSEFLLEEDARQLILHHDGWQPDPAQRIVRLDVEALFGKVRQGFLGIDFGTTSSVVCVTGDDCGFPLVLETTRDGQRRELLASLMFYDGTGDFRFGSAAEASLSTEPRNVVRSLKMVIANGNGKGFRFKHFGSGNEPGHRVFNAQELLDIFIQELRRRAEHGVSYLDVDAREALELGEESLVFRQAVFSHPVEIGTEARKALMRAAHAAGINEGYTAEQFFEGRCVDEATASVLAYVHAMAFRHPEEAKEFSDDQRILCFDMGGGTTDVAAVQVRDLGAFCRGKADWVTVALCGKTGDSSFGGDYLDRRLAREILDQGRLLALVHGLDLPFEELEHAIEAPSLSAFEQGYQKRHAQVTGAADAESSRVPIGSFEIWTDAEALLVQAEKAKRSFAEQEDFLITFSDRLVRLVPRALDEGNITEPQALEVSLKRARFEEIVEREIEQRFVFLEKVIEEAGWQWSDLTTVLFTGRSVLAPAIRCQVVKRIRDRVGAGRKDVLRIVEPEGVGAPEGFDPKLCVALGAALWHLSDTSPESWLRIERPILERLGFDLSYRMGPRYKNVEGLTRGVDFPAKGKVPWSSFFSQLTLYRNQEKYVQFNLPSIDAETLTIHMESPKVLYVEIEGRKYPGEPC